MGTEQEREGVEKGRGREGRERGGERRGGGREEGGEGREFEESTRG